MGPAEICKVGFGVKRYGLDRAGEAELGDLADETIGLNLGRGSTEVVGTEVLVEGSVTEHVVGGQDRGGAGTDRLLGSTLATQALELGLQVFAFIVGTGPGTLHKGGLPPSRSDPPEASCVFRSIVNASSGGS